MEQNKLTIRSYEGAMFSRAFPNSGALISIFIPSLFLMFLAYFGFLSSTLGVVISIVLVSAAHFLLKYRAIDFQSFEPVVTIRSLLSSRKFNGSEFSKVGIFLRGRFIKTGFAIRKQMFPIVTLIGSSRSNVFVSEYLSVEEANEAAEKIAKVTGIPFHSPTVGVPLPLEPNS